MANTLHRSETGLYDVTPAIAEQWERLLDAVEQLETAMTDPACAEQVEPRRNWVRAQALLLVATLADTHDDIRRKLTVMAVVFLHEGPGRTLDMIEAAVNADLASHCLTLDELMAPKPSQNPAPNRS